MTEIKPTKSDDTFLDALTIAYAKQRARIIQHQEQARRQPQHYVTQGMTTPPELTRDEIAARAYTFGLQTLLHDFTAQGSLHCMHNGNLGVLLDEGYETQCALYVPGTDGTTAG